MEQLGPVISRNGLSAYGLDYLNTVYWNLPPALLSEQAVRRGEGRLAQGGAFVALTGEHTGRSPNDKFIVDRSSSRENIDWGKVNVPMTPDHFERLLAKAKAWLQGRDLFVRDVYAGADADHRLKVRVMTQTAWHNMFAANMFITPPASALEEFEPDFTVLQVPGLQADPATDGTNSDVFVVVDFESRLVLIGGTWYAGEIKKSIFSILNYMLPEKGVMPMHCSANIGSRGDTAVFFGLSGTGKTTLSADGSRTLIGDDEHGWSDNGVFNFEGGCYAKVIRLSAQAEPEIYATTSKFGTILENVDMDDYTRMLDLDSARYTENTRASYPLSFIPNVSESGMGSHPETVIMLTADAFGVLPPISQLTPEQAMYHFLSGYTARVAGTEKGLGAEPQATFSTCFGAPFMPRHPSAYAKLLGEKIARHGAKCWLVNTGWSGGRAGIGHRMSISHTRSMVRAALEGKLNGVGVAPDPNFGLLVPEAVPDVPVEVLTPKSTWGDKAAYDETAKELRARFVSNFEKFEGYVDEQVKAAAIQTAA